MRIRLQGHDILRTTALYKHEDEGWELCTENVQPVICHACQQHRGKTGTNGRQDLQHTEPVDVTPALMMLSYRGNVKPATPKTGSRDDARINMSTATPQRTC